MARPIKKNWKGESLKGYAFLFPSLLGFLVFILFPVLFSLILSFSNWSFISGFGSIEFVGVKNFRLLLKDYQFIAAFKNTLYYTFATVPITIILGFIIAVLINRYTVGKTILKIAIFLPYISSIVAISIVWKVLLHPSLGPVNDVLMAIGINNPPKWFGDPKWALTAIAIQTIWLHLGYNVIIFLAGLTAVNEELYDAASIDGAGGFRRVWHIALPGVKATTFFLTIMGMINSFKVFDQISVITQGGPGNSTMVLAYYIYLNAFQFYNMGYASAIAWIMFVLIFVVTIIQWKYGSKQNF